ncbi:hypothetical protein Aperf_G00000012069 [Anoplocephala perfoliata]
MREKERGVVWEESIILLPDRVRQVYLSTTIPNAHQFAEWVIFPLKLPCHLICTDYRPTLFEYLVYSCGHFLLFPVIDEDGELQETIFNGALRLVELGARFSLERKPPSPAMRTFHCSKLIKWVTENNRLPMIVFAFSKIDCQYSASDISDMEFTVGVVSNTFVLCFSKTKVKGKTAVNASVSSASEPLSAEDRKIPQIDEMLPFLRRGIGMHYGSLVMIVKEFDEKIFSEGYLKSKAREIATVIEECRVNPSAMNNSVADPTKGDSSIYVGGDRSGVESYVNKFTGEFMGLVRSWAEGESFAKQHGSSKVFAGSGIRRLRRLDELLKRMRSAAKVAGDDDLGTKLSAASSLIRRDIVFAANLNNYLNNPRSSA